MQPERVQQFEQLGYDAARSYSESIDASNAVERAARLLPMLVSCNRHRFARQVMEVQKRAKVSLVIFLELADDERDAAITAFSGGCYRYGAEHAEYA